MTTSSVESILKELSHFSGNVFLGVPPKAVTLGSRDLIFLKTWSGKDLLALARTQACQVALYSEGDIPQALEPFYDWQISAEKEAQVLESKAIDHSRISANKSANSSQKVPALFLDRDGVINVDHGYVGDPKNVTLIPQVGALIARAKQHHRQVIVVTNQSGVGRGLYGVTDFHRVMQRIAELISVDQAKIDQIEFSPFHPSTKIEEFRFGRQFRKPRPGMIHKAAQERNIDCRKSVMIGDHVKDLMTAALAGVGQIYLLATEEAVEIQKSFRLWVDEVQTKQGIPDLMQGIQFHVLGGLDEANVC